MQRQFYDEINLIAGVLWGSLINYYQMAYDFS